LTIVLITDFHANYSMADTASNIENDIVETTWEDKDTDLVVQYQIDKKLNLESVPELSQ